MPHYRAIPKPVRPQMIRLRAVPALLVAALACAAAAPPTLTPPDPEAKVVADLVVRAPSGGPAWWRVSSGAATVWVLGTPAALPKGLKWNDVELDRRLLHASRVILPPAARFGVFDLFGALALNGKLHGKPFESSLPPDLAQRYAAAAAVLRQSPDHYDRWKPAVAGLVMVADFRKQAGLDAGQPLNAIKSAAARHHLKAAPAVTYPGIPLARMLASELTGPVNLACLSDAMQEIEAGAGRATTAAQAWAVGDVAGALAAERGYERCLAALPNGADLIRQGEADQASAIAQALKAPGVEVAVVELRPLLAEGGVLDRLRAQGYAVRTPGAE
jgi:TraB/PrgY/gumN family